jgi:membrane-bound serine protease (ClpP class)
MAPSTNIGAAHPVSGSGEEIDSVMNEKITNDAAAQIRAAAARRGRNAEWAERAVRESVAITDVEALDSNVIDIRAVDLEDLLAQIDGRDVELPDGDRVMALKDAVTENIETSWAFKFLDIITQPDIAFILFSIGSLGLMLELYNPGSIFPGVVGAISLILAFYAFQTLPINYAGVALIVLAIILFIAEIKVVSHGLLTVGGLISLFLGGLMLIDTVDPNLGVSLSVLVTVVVCVGVVVIAAGWLIIKASKRQVFTGFEGMIGKIAEVRRTDYVYVEGALWKARRVDNEPLTVGAEVEVVAVKGLVLKVKTKNS